MKLNKWTLGLAAIGLVSLSPGLLAQSTNAPAPAAGPAPAPVMTALSATTISGYVDTSMVWNPGTGNANPAPYAFNAGKQDGFNVNLVDLKIAKPLEEGQWSAGYTVELMYGPDAAIIDGGSAPIRQAYVTVRTPVGNGIDWQIGQWDNIIGYEVADSYKDPNWTRSYAWSMEPVEHVGILASYKLCDAASLQVGVANELSTGFVQNNRNISGTPPGGPFSTIESKKAIVSLLTLTAPDSWGSWKGSAFYVGLDYGPGNAFSHGTLGVGGGVPAATSHIVDKTHLYVGATVNTPVKDLTLGAAWDSVNNMDMVAGGVEGYCMTYAGYVSYKITDKLTINGRGEYVHGSAWDLLFANNAAFAPQEDKVFALTGTLQYDLWANVISRLEVRWDASADGSPHFGGTTPGTPTKHNEVMVAANIIYKF
jgi:hypothetical protein